MNDHDVNVPLNQHPQHIRSPQSDLDSNFSFGPGGQASIVSDEDNTAQHVAAPPDLVPQHALAASSGTLALASVTSQPPLQPTPVSAGESMTTSISSIRTAAPSVSQLAPSSITQTGMPEAPTSTSVTVSISTSISLSMVLPPSTDILSGSSLNPSSSPETSPAVVLASSNAVPEPSQRSSLPASPANSSSSHNPPFYVGIVLGTIVIIAIVAALIAWGVRLRSHARRRAEACPDVPWAKPGNSDETLEEGRIVPFSGINHLRLNKEAMDISSQDAMHAHTWEPRGDRDAGEPKRSESFLSNTVSPQRQTTLSRDPFTDHIYPRLAESAAYPHSNNLYKATRPVLSHLTSTELDTKGTVDDHGSASSFGPLQIANAMPGDASASSSRAPTSLGTNAAPCDYGSPREDIPGSRPRFLSLQGEGLHVPWAPASISRPNIKSFGSRRSRLGGDGNWEHLPPFPMPGETREEMEAVERDGWASSLKSNLMHAFNAVAANLPAGPTMEDKQEGYLSPSPPRVAQDRRLSGEQRWRSLSGNSLSRETTTSAAWSLEETGDGSGKVHFRGMQGYSCVDRAFSNTPGSSITLQDDISDNGADTCHLSGEYSQTPLIITKKPKTALLKPDIYSRLSQYSSSLRPAADQWGPISRASSIYSTASGAHSPYPDPKYPLPPVPQLPAFSRHSTMTIGALHSSSKKDGNSNDRPVNASRLSSSGCSFSSYRTDGATTPGYDQFTETDQVVHQAITDRRKRLRRIV